MADPKSIKDLSFDPKNARVRTAKGSAMIQDSLGQVGAARSIVIDENNVILAGNGTVEAAGQVGIERVRVIDASGDEIIAVRRKGLTDEQKKKLAYYDNRTADEAEWDMEQVARDLLEGFDFLDDLFEEVPVPQPETKGGDELPDDPAEILREKWGVEYGDLWQIGTHRILCGDSTRKEDVERLLGGTRWDCVVTSPPYNQGGMNGDLLHTKGVGSGVVKAKLYRNKESDNKTKDEYYNFCLSVFASTAPFASENHSFVWNVAYNSKSRDDYGKIVFSEKNPYHVKETIIWDKGHSINLPQVGIYSRRCEFVFIMSKGGEYLTSQKYGDCRWNYYGISSAGSQSSGAGQVEHRASYPVEFADQCISDFSLPGSVVLDPFLGTGTTIVSSENLGRVAYGIEIDPAYVAVCIERMAQLGYEPQRVEKVEG